MNARTFGALLLCLVASGCFTTGPKLEELKSTIPQLAAGQARIYLYRPSSVGGLIQPSVMLNGERVGAAKPNGFFFVDVPPGSVEVSISTETQQKASFSIEAGQTRYVRVTVGMGLFVGRFYPQLVGDTEGEREMADLGYVGQPLDSQAAKAPPAARPAAPVAVAAMPSTMASGAVATGALPAPGSLWVYSFRDRVFGNRDREFSVRTSAVQDSSVMEILSSGSEQQILSANTREIGFQTRRISGEDFIELSPYLLASVPAPAAPLPQSPRTYPGTGSAQDWKVRVVQVRREEVTVPAGRFDAYRVELAGENENALFATSSAHAVNAAATDYRTQRFMYEAWYAPQIGRYVQIHHKTFNKYGNEIGDEWVQLKKFELRNASPPDRKD
ncbi:MAG TPA: DUF2846 domain-containing protein [Burkholderiales bacterium]